MSKKNKHKGQGKKPPAAPTAATPQATQTPIGTPQAASVETPQAPGTVERPQYEFDAAQNEVINNLALAIIWVRLPLLIAGLLQALIATGLALCLRRDGAHIVGVLSHAVAAVVCFLLASWLRAAAGAFIQVTTTKGRDISHLMTGLRNLAAWFDLLAFFVKMYLILLGVLLLLLGIGLFAAGGAFKY